MASAIVRPVLCRCATACGSRHSVASARPGDELPRECHHSCHPERSEGSDARYNDILRAGHQVLRFAQDDKKGGRPVKASQLASSYDLVVIGGGPAGLAAAALAARAGVSTVLLDENQGIGGQIYRAITSTPVRDRAVLGEDYWA